MIYLDYNATTPIDKEVAREMEVYIHEVFGNPSSLHEQGIRSKRAVEEARVKVAGLLNCLPEEIVFTSGGSESNNSIIKGVAYSCREKGNHLITTKSEHPAVLNPCRFLERCGYEVTYLAVDEFGLVSLRDLEEAITDRTILVTIMHSNNETGTIQPIEEISKVCKARGVLLHTDASQSIGKVPMDVRRLGVDFLTIAGHKLYAPKGVGAFYIREDIEIEPLIHGAGHERARRAGTENVMFDAALGKACELAEIFLEGGNMEEIRVLRDYLHKRLKDEFGDTIKLNGHPKFRLPNTLNISFTGRSGVDIAAALNDIAVSTGSACHAGQTTISPVLKAMGIPRETALGAIRFSLGRHTTREEIDEVVERLIRIV